MEVLIMKKRNYMDSVHFYGRIWCVAAILVLVAVPVLMCIHVRAWPDWGVVGKGFASVAVLFYPTGIIEVIAYAPLLGAGGTYLSFLTGNIANLKLPCALSSMESAKVRANSEEGEIISTISIAASAIVTTLVVALFVLIFAVNPNFTKVMSEGALAPAFKQVTYTIFGALAATYFIKHWKISIFPIAVLSILLAFFGTIQIGVLIFAGVAISMLGAHIMYKLKWV